MEQQFISKSCSWYNVDINPVQILQLTSISSLQPNGLGNFNQCVSKLTHSYFLLQYTINTYKGIFISGLCYNSSCNQADIKYITEAFNQYITLPSRIISIDQIQINSSFLEKINSQQIFFFALIAVFLIIGIISTIANYCSKEGIYTRFGKKIKEIIQLLSYGSSVRVFLRRTNNNQRNKIIVGLRAISFVLMVFHNVGMILLRHPVLNVITQKQPEYWLENYTLFIIMNYYGFDLWFFVNGFTLAVQFSKSWQTNHSIKFAAMVLIRIIVKVWIASLLTLVFIRILLPLFGQGPLWSIAESYLQNQCSFSIGYLLLVSNLYQNQCNYFLWVWDTNIQLSLAASLLFFLRVSSMRWKNLIYLGFHIIFILAAFGLTLIFYEDIDLQSGIIQGWISKSPLIRGIAYFVGFNLGLYYFTFRASKEKNNFNLIKIYRHKICRLISPLLSLLIISMITYHYTASSHYLSKQSQSISSLVFDFMISFSIILFILPNLLGYSGPIKTLLKDRILDNLSKLSFSAYSMLYMVSVFILYNRTDDVDPNFAKVIIYSSVILVMCITLGLVFCITLEIVIYRIINKCMNGETKKFIQVL